VNANPLLFLLLLLSMRKQGGAAPGGGGTAHVFPPAPATPVPVPGAVPVSAPGRIKSRRWKPYHPLTPGVIARAEELLRDPTAPAEVIEKDASGQPVRFLKLNAPPGHLSVTAWRPNVLEQTAAVNV